MLNDPIHAVIVDDEPLARQKLQRWLADDTDITLVGTCGNGYEALDLLHTECVDLLFLDIQMPEMNGFEVLDGLDPNQRPLVVFVTAYDRYAIEAFKRHALDYLLKPYDQERFALTLTRAKAQLQQQQAQTYKARVTDLLRSLEQQQTTHLEHFAIKLPDRVLLLNAEEVDWIEAAGNYVVLHVGSKRHLMRESMSRLEHQLNPQRFARIHRSTIVHVNRIKEFYPASHGDYTVVLKDGQQLFLSRHYRKKLRDGLKIAL